MKPLASKDLEHILMHTEHIWDAACGKRIFLSGGTGFFGAWLLESLAYCNRMLSLNVGVTVLTRDPDAFRVRMPHLADEECIRLLRGDVRTFSLPAGNCEYVIHAAAPTTAIASGTPLALLSTLVDGARRMLEFSRTCGAQRFLLVSSGAVYGRQPGTLSHIPEDYLGGPDWLDSAAAYAEGKRVSELMCAAAARETNIDFRIARCFAFVGPHLPLDQHFAIGNFIGDALAGRPISIQGDGSPLRSYLYAADLAIWLWSLVLADLPLDVRADVPVEGRPLVLNVGSDQAISIGDLAREVVAELKPDLKIAIAKEPQSGAPVLQYVPDVGKARSLLNLRQTIPLRDAIRRTAEWHR